MNNDVQRTSTSSAEQDGRARALTTHVSAAEPNVRRAQRAYSAAETRAGIGSRATSESRTTFVPRLTALAASLTLGAGLMVASAPASSAATAISSSSFATSTVAGAGNSIGPDENHRQTNVSASSPKVGVAAPVDSEAAAKYQKQIKKKLKGSGIEITLEGDLPSTLTRPQTVALTAWMLGDWASFDGDYPNGQMPDDYLKDLLTASGHRLRHDASIMFDLMSVDFMEEFGRPILLTDSYRDYATQVSLKARKPGLAATPGTSNHGWGLAVDLAGTESQWGTAERQWLLDNGWKYGWFSPTWAQPGLGRPEPWHFEYMGTTEIAWPSSDSLLDRVEELNGDPMQGLFAKEILNDLEAQQRKADKKNKKAAEKAAAADAKKTAKKKAAEKAADSKDSLGVENTADTLRPVSLFK